MKTKNIIILLSILFLTVPLSFSPKNTSPILISDSNVIKEENSFETGSSEDSEDDLASKKGIYYTTWGEIGKRIGIHALTKDNEKTGISPDTKIQVINEEIKMVVGFEPTINININAFENSLFSSEIEKSIEKLNAIVISTPITSLKSFFDQWLSSEEIRYIEPSQLYSFDFTPNDPDWSLQWGPQIIQADLAWDIQMGDPSSVLVAVIDTGIDYTHPDLNAQYVPLGYDWVNNDNDPIDDHYHGTHVAGIIAATTNNGIGVASVANVQIMAEKFLSNTGTGTSEDAAAAIIHAVDAGADILSNSWGGGGPSNLLKDALVYAAENDVVVIAAAGNDGLPFSHYPAAYPEVISVSATDSNDNLAYFSNYGDSIEVSAPGFEIYSTFPVALGSYASISGTSMAAPHVSGVAALILSEFPSWSAEQVRTHLWDTSDDLGDLGWDEQYGYGRLNAYKAVQPLPLHDLRAYLYVPSILPVNETIIFESNVTLRNCGMNNETNVELQLWIDDSLVVSQIFPELPSGTSESLYYSWKPTIAGTYNFTVYVVPVPNEDKILNNVYTKFVRVTEIYNYEMVVGVPYNWIDATGGTILNLIDDASSPVSLPFSFQFYDQQFSTVYVGSNGWLSFYNSNPAFYSDPGFPSTNPDYYYSAALFWADLLPNNNIYVLTLTNPNRIVIEYHDIDYYGDRGRAGNFEIILYETGEILFQYNYIDVVRPHLVGLNFGMIPEYFNGYDDPMSLTDDLAILFSYGHLDHDVALNLEIPSFLPLSGTTIINTTISNRGMDDETNVELQLWINNVLETTWEYTILPVGISYKFNWSWTPTVQGIYNITVYIVPLDEELNINNNRALGNVNVFPSSRQILIIYADAFDSRVNAIGALLLNHGFPSVLMNVRSYIPTLTELLPYSVVFVWTWVALDNPVRLGNVLADYLDAGGTAIVSTGSFSSDTLAKIEGRFLDYSPFVYGPRTFTIRDYNKLSTHQIFSGIENITSELGEQVSLSSGASLV
ncbi:MAG: S8 family serine peptidase, partial [Candidatus Hodarchaeales archaeon]